MNQKKAKKLRKLIKETYSKIIPKETQYRVTDLKNFKTNFRVHHECQRYFYLLEKKVAN